MTTPREHVGIATLYFSDEEMMCWEWEEGQDGYHWWYSPNPSFTPGRIYHVGKEAPTEPPQVMCELAGAEFPMPETEAPERGVECWAVGLDSIDEPLWFTWDGHALDRSAVEFNADSFEQMRPQSNTAKPCTPPICRQLRRRRRKWNEQARTGPVAL